LLADTVEKITILGTAGDAVFTFDVTIAASAGADATAALLSFVTSAVTFSVVEGSV
jgi:hypothetical protein